MQSSIGLNTQWGFFWCLKINDFQPKPRVCLWPRDWEGNQAWSYASADHVHLRPWIWNRKQEKFLFTTGYCRDASDIWEPGLWKNEKGRCGIYLSGLLEEISEKSWLFRCGEAACPEKRKPSVRIGGNRLIYCYVRRSRMYAIVPERDLVHKPLSWRYPFLDQDS